MSGLEAAAQAARFSDVDAADSGDACPSSPHHLTPGERAHREAKAACEAEVELWRSSGVPVPTLRGQLIRPLLGRAAAGAVPHERAGAAWLAVQLAHEASLHHDDVIDGATTRRGIATVAASRGIPAALVVGDHLLTAGYRVAASTGSLEFVETYCRALERTVAGERLQNERRGVTLSRSEYEAVVLGKSGELIACAFAADAALKGDPRAHELFETGRRIGLCYQMVDDLLDYCSGADSGKEPFSDFRQRVWTWPLEYLPGRRWPDSREELEHLLAARNPEGRTVLERALVEMESTCAEVLADVHRALPADRAVFELLEGWLARARGAVARSVERTTERTQSPAALPADVHAFFARNSRSFSFAARLFPAGERQQIARLYAFCRVTDDLVDETDSATDAGKRLQAWEAGCRRAYQGGDSGIQALDRVLGEAAGAGVPFAYVEDLLDGMRMDLERTRYDTVEQLLGYAYRVASVVGLWSARLWGVTDSWMLARAADLGLAMQLTNIVRDVGEDWRRGRVYLPRELLQKHQVDEVELRRIQAGSAPSARYRALLEELMELADRHYERAAEAVPLLPAYARRPVAVAAAVYRGIHDEVRANGYDNVTRRAVTSLPRKVRIGGAALWRLARSQRVAGHRLAARTAALVAALTSVAAPGSAQTNASRPEDPANAPPSMMVSFDSTFARLRSAYGWALAEEDSVPAAARVAEEVRHGPADLADAHGPRITAYEGAIELLRAKHGVWPLGRWSAARKGLELLDRAVAADPADVEIRYLRLINGFNVPGIFGRSEHVREDFGVLTDLLITDAPAAEPVRRDAVRFLLANGTLDPPVRARLEALLRGP